MEDTGRGKKKELGDIRRKGKLEWEKLDIIMERNWEGGS